MPKAGIPGLAQVVSHGTLLLLAWMMWKVVEPHLGRTRGALVLVLPGDAAE